MAVSSIQSQEQKSTSRSQWLSTNWLGIFLTVYGIWVFSPFLAPLLMKIGWGSAGKAIYFIYSFFCHQLPERSFFLFGKKTMYSISEIQAAWQITLNPMILRQFIGNEGMGWKIAWSDRMISFYTSVWFFAVAWFPFRRKIKPLLWWGFALLLIPLAVDGGTHAISDLAGIGQGFRDTNQWLAMLTHNLYPISFYAGDALGSFNSIMRFITGTLAGLGITWLAFPYLEESFGKD
jgi:Predicted membrane protein